MAPAPDRKHNPRPKATLRALPWKEFVPISTAELRVILIKFGPTAQLIYLLYLEKTVGKYKDGRPEEVKIPDAQLTEFTNASEDAVRKAKRQLEAGGVLMPVKGRNSVYRRNPEGLKRLIAEELPPPRKAPRQECKPRTEPERETVILSVPPTEEAIHQECSDAGGHGTKCACLWHKLIIKNVCNEGVTDDQPRTHSGLDNSPPPESPPAAPPKNHSKDSTTGTRTSVPDFVGDTRQVTNYDAQPTPLTGVELRSILSQACMDTFGRIAATGPLWDQTAEALETRHNIPALEAKIRETARDKRLKSGKLKLGVIREFAREIAAEARAGENIANAKAPPPPAEPTAEEFAALEQRERESMERYEAKARVEWAAAKTSRDRAALKVRYPDVEF
jgi:hypothetical protein